MLNSDFTELYWYSLNVYIFPENSSNQSCAFTVWKLRKFSLTLFWQKFRESNVFTKELKLIWRNILSVIWERISHFFNTVVKLSLEKYIVKSIWRMNVDFTEILLKRLKHSGAEKLCNFTTATVVLWDMNLIWGFCNLIYL